jgi:hypothetical protein
MQINDIVSSKIPAPGQDAAGAGGGHDALRLTPVDGAEFREIMARQAGPAGAPGQAAPAAGAGAGGHAGLGERIMQRAGALSGELRKDQQYISRSLEQATRSGDSMQLMQAMLALSDYQTRVQFVSKAASKAASAIDQLTKLQ